MPKSVFFILVLVMFINCKSNNKETNVFEKEANQIAALESRLKLTQDTLSESKSLQGQLVEVNEVLRSQNDSLVEALIAQSANLALARNGIFTLLAQHDAVYALSDSVIEAKDLIIKNEQNSICLAWDFADEVKQRLGSIEKKLQQYQAWYGYYKPVAKRSIFKHLFGVGKPQKPEVSEPEPNQP